MKLMLLTMSNFIVILGNEIIVLSDIFRLPIIIIPQNVALSVRTREVFLIKEMCDYDLSIMTKYWYLSKMCHRMHAVN